MLQYQCTLTIDSLDSHLENSCRRVQECEYLMVCIEISSSTRKVVRIQDPDCLLPQTCGKDTRLLTYLGMQVRFSLPFFVVNQVWLTQVWPNKAFLTYCCCVPKSESSKNEAPHPAKPHIVNVVAKVKTTTMGFFWASMVWTFNRMSWLK